MDWNRSCARRNAFGARLDKCRNRYTVTSIRPLGPREPLCTGLLVSECDPARRPAVKIALRGHFATSNSFFLPRLRAGLYIGDHPEIRPPTRTGRPFQLTYTTVRHFLALIVLVCLSAAHAIAQQNSTWWYPLGNPEGTRRNPVQLDTQSAAALTVKWRTQRLAGSPTLLVGALHNRPKPVQHVVGSPGDTAVVVLTERGLVNGETNYAERFATPVTVRLTGLLNRQDPIPLAPARPVAIGVGIERRQANASDSLYCALADASGAPFRLVGIFINPSPPLPDAATARIGIYPLVLYENSVLLATTRSTNSGRSPQANTVRKYRFGTGGNPDQLVWQYPVAPRVYPQQAAITRDLSEITGKGVHIALATEPYSGDQRYSVTPPGGIGDPTSSDVAYSIALRDPGPDSTRVLHTMTNPLPKGSPGTAAAGASYYATLHSFADDAGTYFRVAVSEFDAAHPRLPVISLWPAFRADSSDTATFYPPVGAENRGWTIAAANVDGDAPDRTQPGPGAAVFFNNKFDEIVAAYRNAEQTDIENNTLWVLRRNQRDRPRPSDSLPLRDFIQHPFNGRLMAAGHLVAESVNGIATNKEEIVVAYRNTIQILRLKDYQDDVFDGLRPGPQPFFEEVRSFQFDTTVTSVAIADIDDDRRNDLIVGTLGSTYAIGLAQPEPFGTFAADAAEYCSPSRIRISWERTIGGDSVVNVRIYDDQWNVVAEYPRYRRYATTDGLNPGTGPETLEIAADDLPPGTHRAVVSDPLAPNVADTSAPFVIKPPVIDAFAVTPATAEFGQPILITADVACAAEVRLQRSFDGDVWVDVRPVSVSGGNVTARDTIACPADACDAGDSVVVWYRYVSRAGGVATAPKRVAIPVATLRLGVTAGTTIRGRTIMWNAGTFVCPTLKASFRRATDTGWTALADDVNAQSGRYAFDAADSISGAVFVRLCCNGDAAGICRRGVASFEIPPLADSAFVVPNPFAPGSSTEAIITFSWRSAGQPSVTIYDAARAVVRQLETVGGISGLRQAQWDGRNSRGEIVAAGTYICVVENADRPVVLPIIVSNH